ncbi:hypothetical protein [Ruegeria sp.]|uniref:hypothetical protein n=1 Tax=Ruegeria sp. TaxID=1879320 RepID=UPI003B5B0ACF
MTILVGFIAAGVALFSGYSLLTAFGFYVLFGWLFILCSGLAIFTFKALKKRIYKQRHPVIS